MSARLGWIDVISTDLPRSLEFYRRLFGWERRVLDDPHAPGYSIMHLDGEPVAGAEPVDPSKGPPSWTLFVVVDDISAAMAAAVANGGSERFAPLAMGDLGMIGLARDPLGDTIGLWQPDQLDPHPSGLRGQLMGGVLASADPDRAAAFYAGTFDWHAHREETGSWSLTGVLPMRIEAGNEGVGWVPVLAACGVTPDDVLAAGGEVLEGAGCRVTDPLGASFQLG